MIRMWLTIVGVLLPLFSASVSHSQPLESLKTRFEADVAAFNAQDPTAARTRMDSHQ